MNLSSGLSRTYHVIRWKRQKYDYEHAVCIPVFEQDAKKNTPPENKQKQNKHPPTPPKEKQQTNKKN